MTCLQVVVYLLFTGPRATMICLQGVFATSSRHSSAAASVTASGTDSMVYVLLGSLSELACSVYQASLLPMLASYHYDFRRLLVSTSSRCCCRCCSRRRSAQIDDDNPVSLTTATTTHGSVRKSVKFDLHAVEFEI